MLKLFSRTVNRSSRTIFKDVISSASLSPMLLTDRDSKIREIFALLGKPRPFIYEIGAFKGHYLMHLQMLGYKNVRGLEHSSDSVFSAKAQGIELDQGYLLDESCNLSPESRGDIVICFNFIEHIPDPFQFIQSIKSKIASDFSYFYFTMPSFEYILPKIFFKSLYLIMFHISRHSLFESFSADVT